MSDPEAPIVQGAVAAVRSGDREAFAQIVQVYGRRLFGLSLMMTRDPSGAEEVVQDAFVRAFANLDAYDARRPFYPWISTIAVRLAQNWLVQRSRRHTREGAELGSEHDAPSGGADPLADMIADERDRRLWRSVAALPSGERTAMILYYRQDMSVGEIASAIGVSSGTIKTLLFRGRQRLRRTVGDLSNGKDSS
ncbi:MAG: sigma-70 family RNA polymerase sigma factor [Zetaproteobacteria bacterium]|nr:MAG: sigma-70 family RNA polymerase sigma factor [Zetaproteobacteria bacterium]